LNLAFGKRLKESTEEVQENKEKIAKAEVMEEHAANMRKILDQSAAIVELRFSMLRGASFVSSNCSLPEVS
jgi:hypothetical protein